MIALSLSLLVAFSPVQARSAPAQETARARVEALYSDAAAALERDDPAGAAACYAEVLEVLPEHENSHGSRVLALADALAAYRAASTGSSSAEPLCAAIALVRAYRSDLSAHYGPHAAERDGAMLAVAEESALTELLVTKDMSCGSGDLGGGDLQDAGVEAGSGSAAEPVPAAESATEPGAGPASGPGPSVGLDPAPSSAWPGRKGLTGYTLGGAVGLGIGGVFLGVMSGGLIVGARATRDAATLRAEMPSLTVDDPEFDEVIARGRRGDRAAIIAGVGAGVALAVVAILIAIGTKRAQRRAQARISATPTTEIGRAFVVRFGSL